MIKKCRIFHHCCRILDIVVIFPANYTYFYNSLYREDFSWGKKGLILILIFFIIFNVHTLAAKYELGDQGEGVKQIQQYLYDIGYDVDIDGIYGHRTVEIVKNFQYNNGLKVDGIVGEETLAVLEEMVKDITYVVQPGDTLSEIAAKYNITVKALKDFNRLKNDMIRIGQELKIPRTGIGGGEDGNVYTNIFHEVRPGDSLYLLARKYGVEIETIKLANNLRTDIIYVGQNLVIPHLQRDVNQPFELKKGAFIWPCIWGEFLQAMAIGYTRYGEKDIFMVV